MIDSKDLEKRHILPRWETISAAKQAGEFSTAPRHRAPVVRLEAVKQSGQMLAKEFDRRKLAWDQLGDQETAEELLSTAIVSGNTKDAAAKKAAMFVLGNDVSGSAIREFAAEVIGEGSPQEVATNLQEAAVVHTEIARRKRLLKINPRDALLLTEMALMHANLGQKDTSRKFLDRAIKLSPNNRYVLRSAARFLCHIRRPDEALHLLTNSQRSAVDPWVCSAEMAVSALVEQRTVKWKTASQLINEDSFSARDKSELATEIATLELQSGSTKKGMRMLGVGATDPTENAVAQFEFLVRNKIIGTSDLAVDLGRSMEASAHRSYASENFQEAIDACDRWQFIEPFSIRPAIFGTFLSTTDRSNLERGLLIGERGRLSNPNDPTLLNNIAVIHAYLGDVEKASDFARKASAASKGGPRLPERRTVVNLATEGLILFRRGEFEAATRKYEEAMNLAVEQRDGVQALRAYCFFSREVSEIDPSLGSVFGAEIGAISKLFEDEGIKLPRDVELLRKQISEPSDRRRIAELNFRPFSTNLLTGND